MIPCAAQFQAENLEAKVGTRGEIKFPMIYKQLPPVPSNTQISCLRAKPFPSTAAAHFSPNGFSMFRRLARYAEMLSVQI